MFYQLAKFSFTSLLAEKFLCNQRVDGETVKTKKLINCSNFMRALTLAHDGCNSWYNPANDQRSRATWTFPPSLHIFLQVDRRWYELTPCKMCSSFRVNCLRCGRVSPTNKNEIKNFKSIKSSTYFITSIDVDRRATSWFFTRILLSYNVRQNFVKMEEKQLKESWPKLFKCRFSSSPLTLWNSTWEPSAMPCSSRRYWGKDAVTTSKVSV